MSATVYTVTYACKHTTEQLANAGAVAMIREVAARNNCKSCQAKCVEPIRFASGWKTWGGLR